MVRFNFLTLIFSVVVLTLTSCSSTSVIEEENLYVQTSISPMEQEVIDLVNEYRSEQGLETLEFGTPAYEFADSHNTYMISKGEISHDNFATRSSNLTVKANANFVSENVGKDFVTAKGVVNAWINSTTHKNVMEGEFKYTAVSVKADADGVLYFTQLFYQ